MYDWDTVGSTEEVSIVVGAGMSIAGIYKFSVSCCISVGGISVSIVS